MTVFSLKIEENNRLYLPVALRGKLPAEVIGLGLNNVVLVLKPDADLTLVQASLKIMLDELSLLKSQEDTKTTEKA